MAGKEWSVDLRRIGERTFDGVFHRAATFDGNFAPRVTSALALDVLNIITVQ
jgi:hypothetical protein